MQQICWRTFVLYVRDLSHTANILTFCNEDLNFSKFSTYYSQELSKHVNNKKKKVKIRVVLFIQLSYLLQTKSFKIYFN